MERFCQSSRVLGDLCLRPFRQALRRIDRDTVSGVDARTLDMLHDARDQDVCTVAYRIDLDLLALQVLVYQDRMILRDPVDDADELVDIIVIDGDLHALAAQHVGRTHKHRIAQAVRHFFGFLRREYGAAGRTRDLALFQDLVEELPVLRLIHVLRGCTEDRHAHLHQGFRQLDGRLSAELHYRAVRFLNVHDALHIFRCEGLEIQLVRDIKVRTYGFRVIVDDDRLVPFFCKCPCTVYGTEVELDALSDADRAGTEDKDFLLAFSLFHFVLAAVYGIIVRRLRRELSRARIHDLICSYNAVRMAHIVDLTLALSGQPGDHIVRELDPLRLS